MFSTYSPYSPFFTSGLLSQRRGSIPYTHSNYTCRSFLSLDLAQCRNTTLDSLRTIPSPKPAPSITLPQIPLLSPNPSPVPSLPPRLPSIHSPGPLDIVRRSSLPLSRKSKSSKARRTSMLTTSTVCTRVRRINRSDALARLEGRSKPLNAPSPIRAPLVPRNFMSMSDDEDDMTDGDSDIDALHIDAPSDDENDEIPTPKSEYIVKGRKRSRHGKNSNDWFPLKSFIDLHADDDPAHWSWRSFVEIAHAL